METIWKKGFKYLDSTLGLPIMKKITITVIIIAAAIIIGFGVWTISPYFTNTTIDEPLPTGVVFSTQMEMETAIKSVNNL
jgi:hypothetical protein